MKPQLILVVVLALMALEGLALLLAPDLVRRAIEDAPPGALRVAGLVELALATALAIAAALLAGS